MALEYSRFNKFFSFSCKFNVCSVFAWRPNDFVLPKLNLHIKHISIGFVIFVITAALDFSPSAVEQLVVARVAALPPLPLAIVVFGDDGSPIWCASLAETTRNEWIFGLFDVTDKLWPSSRRRRRGEVRKRECMGAEDVSEGPGLRKHPPTSARNKHTREHYAPVVQLSPEEMFDNDSFSESMMYALPSAL